MLFVDLLKFGKLFGLNRGSKIKYSNFQVNFEFYTTEHVCKYETHFGLIFFIDLLLLLDIIIDLSRDIPITYKLQYSDLLSIKTVDD